MNKKLPILLLIILALNLIWEFSHYRFYIDLTGIPPNIHLIGAAFVDVFLVSVVFAIVSLKNKNLNWLNKPKKKDYLSLIIIGLVLAFFWELINLSLGRWQYSESMPVILGVGLSPLIQLATTGSLSLIISKIFFFYFPKF